MKRVFLGQRLELLAKALISELDAENILFQNKTILVPHLSLKNWLFLQMAIYSRSRVAAGVHICCIEEWLYSEQFGFPTRLELQCLIYQELEASKHPDLMHYLQTDVDKRAELSQQLTSYFFAYGDFGSEALFSKPGWQSEILRKIFVDGPFRLPFQYQAQSVPETIHCFGFDFFPFALHSLIQRCPNVNLYLFSPSIHFIEDLCTPFEKRRWVRLWDEKGVSPEMREELDLHMDQTPLPLSHWGKLGREMAKNLDAFESIELYDLQPPSESMLQQVQQEILHYETTEKEPRVDGSIDLFLTGSSKLHEIEALYQNILKLVEEKKISFSEITVLAPNIQPYVPLIELVFSRMQIPYRIESVEIGRQSSFYQGFFRLLKLASEIWHGEEVAALIETPSFYRRLGWEQENVMQYATHAAALFSPDGDWQKRLEKRSFDHIAYSPAPILERESGSSWELLEALYDVLSSLDSDLAGLSSATKSLFDWAVLWKNLVDQYLFVDEADEADEAFSAHLNRMFREMLNAPFSIASTQCSLRFFASLLKTPLQGQIHGSQLHAVRFASLEPCVAISSEAIFLIGMDEASFPRKKISSSLDLLQRQSRIDSADRDRYLFLQLLFAARQYLAISYGHLSQEDGKPVGPSHVVHELVSYLGKSGIKSQIRLPKLEVLKAPMLFRIDPCEPPSEMPSQTVALAAVNSFIKHPWKYFLQKRGIDLPKQSIASLSLERYPLMLASLEWPIETIFKRSRKEKISVFKEAFQVDVVQKASLWQERLRQWGGSFFSLHFLETAISSQAAQEAEWTDRSGKFISSAFFDGGSQTTLRKAFQWERPPIEVGNIRVVGKVKRVLPKGYLHVGDDSFVGLLKVWPEALAALVGLGSCEIFCLKSGRIKVVPNPLQSLERLLSYFFRASSSLSPLLPQWADFYFRKGVNAFEEKKDWDDPIIEWILARMETGLNQSLFSDWAWTKEVFADLISLYPTRSRGESDAAL